jgi:CHASE2 domain-containing sensor protein
MEYQNFDLCIENKLGENYQVKAQSETMGEAQGVFTLSSECLKIAAELKNIETIEPDSQLPMNLGRSLHQCLFNDSVGDMLRTSLGAVLRDDEMGMRIRLILSPPELAALPWEVLYDQRAKCFLSTSGKTPLTRYIELFEPIRSLKIRRPVKVLVLIPAGSGLDVSSEEKMITDALKDLETVEMRVLKNKVTRSLISRALVEDEYHILHFIGHGRFESDQAFLEINSEEGGRDLIPADAFADFFRSYPSLKLIVLNSCQGAEVSATTSLAGMAPQLVVRGIPAVVAMQYPISDSAALKFAAEFYLKLCKGWSRGQVDTAVSHARNRIHMDIKEEPMAFATPVLFMRSPTGIIFDFEHDTGRLSDFLKPFSSSPVKNVNRLKEVNKTHEANIEAWEEQIKDGDPETVKQASLAIAHEKQEISAVEDRIIRWNRTFLSSALATLLIFFLGYVGLFNFPFHVDDWLEAKFIPYMDAYVPKKFSQDVRLILADEGGNGDMKEPGPEWRQYHGPLVIALAKARAKVIVFDLEVNDPTPYDSQFAEAIKTAESQGTNVVLAKALDEYGVPVKDIAEDLRKVVNDRWGNIDVGEERGGLVRVYQLGQPARDSSAAQQQTTETDVVPSLGLQAITRFLSKGSTVKTLFNDETEQIQLRLDGSLIKSIPVYQSSLSLYHFPYDLVKRARLNDATRSYKNVYDRRADDPYLREYQGKIVIIGFKHKDDSWALQGEQRFGAEIHANVISNILSDVYVRLLPTIYDFLIVAFMAGFGALVQARFRHVFSVRISMPFTNKQFDVPGLLFAMDVIYLLAAFLIYKNERLYILKSYHLAAPFIAYWLTAKMRRKATLKPT